MMNLMKPKREWISIGLCLATCAGVSLMEGCRHKKEEVVVAPLPPPPPPAPEAPKVTPIADLMAELNIDPRVKLPEEKAPDNNADRKAVLVFFDAFARGDANAVKTMLPETDQHELAALISSGAWKESASHIKSIDVQTGHNTLNNKCALAVIETAIGAVSNFQPQLWYYTSESGNGLFEAAPTPPGIIDKLSGSDWIAAWHKILAEEMALADLPEEEFTPVKKVMDKRSAASANSDGGGGGAKGLRGPGGAPTITAPGLGPGGGEKNPGSKP